MLLQMAMEDGTPLAIPWEVWLQGQASPVWRRAHAASNENNEQCRCIRIMIAKTRCRVHLRLIGQARCSGLPCEALAATVT